MRLDWRMQDIQSLFCCCASKEFDRSAFIEPTHAPVFDAFPEKPEFVGARRGGTQFLGEPRQERSLEPAQETYPNPNEPNCEREVLLAEPLPQAPREGEDDEAEDDEQLGELPHRSELVHAVGSDDTLSEQQAAALSPQPTSSQDTAAPEVTEFLVFFKPSGKKMGAELAHGTGKDSGKVLVKTIRPNGMFEEWNEQNPGKEVKAGCLILELNGDIVDHLSVDKIREVFRDCSEREVWMKVRPHRP
mmetsp:Transcript_27224/g.62775  ORF Transcript_27224/g.62775 Transcript_27224/m.62775 type:complete len:246 (+) Transcript_27224:67-804(+)